MASAQFYSIIAGVGAGTGRSCALKFARAYPVVLLARKPDSYRDVVTEIEKRGGTAFGLAADVTDESSMDAAFSQIKQKLPGARLAAAVYNAGSGYNIKPFLELKTQDLDGAMVGVRGLFIFSHRAIPLLVDAASQAAAPHPPTMVVTGATASIRGSARFASFAAGKFAIRAMSQSLAREFGPQGVHVAHSIIDGVIYSEATKGYTVNNGIADGKLDPDAIAEAYWNLHTQPRTTFTHELDLRPYIEKF